MFNVGTDVESLPDELRSRGLRVTAPRLAVFRAVAETPGHPDVEAVAARARALIGTLSTQAVYDALHAGEPFRARSTWNSISTRS